MTRAWRLPVRNGLHAALAGGTLHPPAPAVCLLDGLPPRRLRRQGRCGTRCAPFLASLRDGLRPALTAPAARWPGATRSPGAGEDPVPDQQAGGADRGGPDLDPTPARTC
jgi:hypothetical protein